MCRCSRGEHVDDRDTLEHDLWERVQVALGMGLIVLSQAVQAAQVTFEDYFMSEMSIPAMKIVGYEGVVGTFLMLFVMAPIVRLLPGVMPFTAASLWLAHVIANLGNHMRRCSQKHGFCCIGRLERNDESDVTGNGLLMCISTCVSC